MAEGSRDWLRAWEDFRIAEVEEYREIDHERVLVLMSASGRAKTSGLEVGQLPSKGAALFHVRTATSRGSCPTHPATAASPTSGWRGRRCRGRTWRLSS